MQLKIDKRSVKRSQLGLSYCNLARMVVVVYKLLSENFIIFEKLHLNKRQQNVFYICRLIPLSPFSPSQPFLILPVSPSLLYSPLFLEQRSWPTGSCKFLSVKWIISQKIGVAFTQMVSFSFNQCVVFSYMVSIQPSCNFFYILAGHFSALSKSSSISLYPADL